jgi:glycosyltransferase involved in cell wall biosynthesis
MSVGGPIISNLGLLSELVKKKHEVKVLTTNRNGNEIMDVTNGVKNGIDISYFTSIWGHRFSAKLLFNILSQIKKYQIIHVDDVFSIYTIFSLFINIYSKKTFIFSPRGTLIAYVLKKEIGLKKLLKILLIKILSNLISRQSNFAFHFTSQKEKKEAERLLALFKLAKQKSFVVPNGLNVIANMVPRKLKRDKQLKIVTLGRINHKKRLDMGIRAVGILVNKGVDVKYNIVGNDDDGTTIELQNTIRNLNLEGIVKINPPIFSNAKYDFLKRHNIFLLTSKSENFGNVILEALSIYLPVVITRNLPWEILKDLKIGTICYESAASVSDAIIQQYEKECIANDFDNFLKSYEWETLCETFLKHVEEV